MAVLFDPKNGTDRVASGAAIAATSTWSAYWWMRRASTTGGQPWSLGTTAAQIEVYYSASTADRMTIYRRTSGTAGNWTVQGADDGFAYSASQWVFVAVTQSGISTPTVYTASPVQSVALATRTVGVGTTPTGSATTPATETMFLGNWSGFDYALGGDLAWFGFHNVVLTAGEIEEAMWRGFTLRGAVLLTPLESTSKLYDLSGNAHTLTNTGAADTADAKPPVHPLWVPTDGGWAPKAAAADQTVNPSGLAVPATLGAPTITPGAVTVSPGGLAVPATLGTPTITPGAITASPAGLAVPVTHGAPTLTPGAVTVSPAGLGVAVSLGTPTLTPGPVSVSPAGLGVPVSLGSPTITPGTATVSPSGLAVPVALGSPSVTGGLVVSPSGLGVAVAFGTPTLTPGPVTLTPTGMSVAVTFGAPTITPGAVTVSPSGLAVPVGFGAASASKFAAHILAKGPLAYYRLEEPNGNPQDSSGNEQHLTSTSANTTRGVTGGVIGEQGYGFTWSNDLSGTGNSDRNSSGLDPRPTTAITVAALVKMEGTAANWSNLVSHGWANQGSFLLYESASQVQFGVVNGSSIQRNAGGATIPRDDEWHRVVGTYDGSNVRLYVDGSLVATTAISTPPTLYSGTSFLIGDAAAGCSTSLDEVSIHGDAWSAEEVAEDWRRVNDVGYLEPAGLAVPVTFGSPAMAPGPVTVSPSGHTVSVALGTPTVSPGAVTVSPAGLGVPVSLGSPAFAPGPITESVSGLAVPVSFGAPGVSLLSNLQEVEAAGLAVPVSAGEPVLWTARNPRLFAAQDRRLQESVLLRSAGGYWAEVGKGAARGITVEGLQVNADGSGPRSASFTLRRDPGRSWSDLGAFNAAIVSLGGVPVASGRVRETPGSRTGGSLTMSVSVAGWQAHEDDDVVSMGWVHSRLGDWQDLRNDVEGSMSPGGTVQTGGQITMGWKLGDNCANATAVGVRLDLGAGHPGAVRIALACHAVNPNGFANVYVRLHDHPNPLIAGSLYSDQYSSSFSGIATDPTSPTIINPAAASRPYRYCSIFLYRTDGLSGATGADHMLTVQWARLFSDDAYESSGDSVLTASDVITDVVTSGALPHLSSSTDLIEQSDFAIPDYWPEAYSTPRQLMEAVNAYHDWQLGVDAERRVFFRAPEEVPSLECGAWSGADWSDASASSGEDTYNKVVGEATGADGSALRMVRWSVDASPGLGTIHELGTPSNGGFETNTTGWTASHTGTTITRTTGNFYEGAASAFISTPTGEARGEVQVTISGLEVGRIYTVRVPHKSHTTGLFTADPYYYWWARVYDGSTLVAETLSEEQSSTWQVHYVTFVAPATSLTLKVGGIISYLTGTVCFIDGIRTYRAEVNVVDRHKFVRAARLPVEAAMTEAGLEQVLVTWLRNHVTTPLKGSIVVSAHGGVRTALGGAPLHPGHLLGHYGAAIRLSDLEDPDTGGWGRTGRIASVSYDHDAQTATLEIDNERHRLESLLSRLAALTGQVA